MTSWVHNSQVDRKNLLECPCSVTTRQQYGPTPFVDGWNRVSRFYLTVVAAHAHDVWQDSQNRNDVDVDV